MFFFPKVFLDDFFFDFVKMFFWECLCKMPELWRSFLDVVVLVCDLVICLDLIPANLVGLGELVAQFSSPVC